MTGEKCEDYDGDDRCERNWSGDCNGVRLCYTAFVNVIILVVMIMLLYRTCIGFQDDIVLRTAMVVARLTGNGSDQKIK
uniref:Envelope glycoprotein 24 n=1 Tax=Mastomys natalensis cytomegalovirus 2 TaxID=2973540 RepID=A0A9Y1IQQ0_9BETA|nr:envelope glycoprotein 24 [Mastomys natalensis cytomegalovirus 2]WEG69207.1 envelope glycoprotein 24 [Mastomys natalensis cytomegalovirus 2]WEG69346.1 envelope glycoprotein 24 [Mastomys natalensis cytomegalovirus 2]WEG69484.1 envelope glycoprotein 24 [Mastomys natalensis cytomegalovirus 2]WEG69622.1 envelope glycoprotein 24 [Mastomys natalensis cytomegalovirus 2]